MKNLNLLILTFGLVYFSENTFASNEDAPSLTRTYTMTKHQSTPVIDGDWSDEVWQSIEVSGDFVQSEPVENAPPTYKTEVKIFYTDNAIYLAAYCYDPEPDKILKQLGTRDDNLNADNFRVDIDPYDAQQDFTSFWLTASGVQGDFKRSDGNFNAVWESAVSIVDDGWVLEMRIPYSALRFPKESEQQWSIQMWRHIRRLQEDDVWSPTKRENSNDLDFYGKLTDIKDIDPPVRLSLTPYINLQLKSVPDENAQKEFDWLISGGADLKYGINESFTIDMTLLPDFSQVQSDDIINNLSAFETTFDEQRTFFQEGVDLFRQGGLFYSRRIGARVQNSRAAGNALEEGEEILDNPETSRLLNAFKISGRTKNDVGIGVFNAIEGKSYAKISQVEGGTRKIQTDPLSNYNIFVLEKNFKKNRSIYGINTNVTRTDGYQNANVTGGGFSANFADNQYNVRGAASYSLINQKPVDDGDDETVEPDKWKKGYQYVFDFDKVAGQWRYGWRTEAKSEDYDINDLGVNFQTNFYQHGWSTNYNIYEPLKNVRYLRTLLFASVRQHMPTGEVSSIELNMNANTTFSKSFVSVYGGIFSNLYGQKDYFEARTPGVMFRQPKYANIYAGLETDNRKKLSFLLDPYLTIAPSRGGSYVFGTGAGMNYRPNDHLTLYYRINATSNQDDIGFASRNTEGDPVFGKRDILTFNNVISGDYIIKNNLSIGVRARHYWSRVEYEKFYELTDDGNLTSTLYADHNGNDNVNFSTFNIDLLFNWEFAPGSALTLSYKNDVLDYRTEIHGNLGDNFKNLFENTQSNIVSVRLIYYLDYNTVRGWVGKKRNRVDEA